MGTGLLQCEVQYTKMTRGGYYDVVGGTAPTNPDEKGYLVTNPQLKANTSVYPSFVQWMSVEEFEVAVQANEEFASESLSSVFDDLLDSNSLCCTEDKELKDYVIKQLKEVVDTTQTSDKKLEALNILRELI
jgi:hypothetical protein